MLWAVMRSVLANRPPYKVSSPQLSRWWVGSMKVGVCLDIGGELGDGYSVSKLADTIQYAN